MIAIFFTSDETEEKCEDRFEIHSFEDAFGPRTDDTPFPTRIRLGLGEVLGLGLGLGERVEASHQLLVQFLFSFVFNPLSVGIVRTFNQQLLLFTPIESLQQYEITLIIFGAAIISAYSRRRAS
jgi:hypothetical protein